MQAHPPSPATEAYPVSGVNDQPPAGRRLLQWPAYLLKRYRHINMALLDQAIVSGANLTTGILLARFLGLTEFGRFSLLWMVVLFWASLQNALIVSPMMSIGPKQDATEARAYYGVVVSHQLGLAVFAAVLMYLGAWVSAAINPEWRLGAWVLPIAAVIPASQLQEFCRRHFFTQAQPGHALVNDCVSYLGQLLGLGVLVWQNALSLEAVLWLITLTSGLAVGHAIMVSSFSERLRPVFRRANWWTVSMRQFRFSRWLVGAAILQWLSGNYLIITAAAVLGASAVGALKACQNILGVTHILFKALENLVPVRSACLLSQSGLPVMERYLLKTGMLGGLLTLLLALPALFLPELTLQFLYGSEFSGFGRILVIYGMIYLVLYINQILTLSLRSLEATRPVFVGYVLTSVLSFVIAYPLAQYVGLIGTVSGLGVLALVNCVTLFLGYWFKRREYRQEGASS